MPRFARVVVPDVPHHVTQRGNARQIILDNDADRNTYFALLRQYSALHHLSLLGYCLMSNHVHLIVVPHTADGLAQAMRQATEKEERERSVGTKAPPYRKDGAPAEG